VESVLQTSSCSEGATVTNDAGSLKCKEALPPNAVGVPEGSFTDSCHGCTLDASVLACTCFNGAGATFATTLDLPCEGTIGNAEGTLRCEEPPERRLGEVGGDGAAPSGGGAAVDPADTGGGTGYTPGSSGTEAVAVEATGEVKAPGRDEL
jgi:hypothetical protein